VCSCQAKFKAVTIVGSYQLSAQESNLITMGNAALVREVRELTRHKHITNHSLKKKKCWIYMI